MHSGTQSLKRKASHGQRSTLECKADVYRRCLKSPAIVKTPWHDALD